MTELTNMITLIADKLDFTLDALMVVPLAVLGLAVLIIATELKSR